MADVLPGYTYNPDTQRYRNLATGRFVARREITNLLDAQVSSAESRLSELATVYHEGRIAPSVWTEQMRTEVRRLSLQQIALAAGGFDQLTQRDYGRAGYSLREQYARIVGTAQDVQDGRVTLPQLLNRIVDYVGMARTLYHMTQRDNGGTTAEGMTTIARRRLDPFARHCVDCPEYYQRGWVMLSELVPPGIDCQCAGHCRCTVDYRDVPTSELDQWLGTMR